MSIRAELDILHWFAKVNRMNQLRLLIWEQFPHMHRAIITVPMPAATGCSNQKTAIEGKCCCIGAVICS